MKDKEVGTDVRAPQNCFWFGKTCPKYSLTYQKGDTLRVHIPDTESSVLDPKHLFLIHDEDLTFGINYKAIL